MSLLDDLKGKRIAVNGVTYPDRKKLEFLGEGAVVTDLPSSDTTQIDLSTFVATIKPDSAAALRSIDPIDEAVAYTKGYATPGDGGGGFWIGVTGAALATYTHNEGTVIVPSGGDGSAAWVRQYDGAVHPEWWGADATGATASDAATKSAQEWAWRDADLDKNEAIEFGAGVFLFTGDNPLGQYSVTAPARRGVLIKGQGVGATTLLHRPGASAPTHFYSCDNAGTPTDQQLLFPMFRDFALEFSATGSSAGAGLNGFLLNPKVGTPAQNFRFHNVDVVGDTSVSTYAGTVFEVIGSVNGSENSWAQSKIRQMKTFIKCSNLQSIDYSIFAVDAENMFGDVLSFTAGGQLAWVGGSIITDGGITSDAFVLNTDGATAGLNETFNFLGIKTELRNTFAKLVKTTHPNNVTKATFRSCNFSVLTGGTRDLTEMDADCSASVTFDDCDVSTAATFRWATPTTASFWVTTTYQAAVYLNRCKVPSNILESAVYESGARGTLQTNECEYVTTLAAADPGVALNGITTGAGQIQPRGARGASLKGYTGLIRIWPTATQLDAKTLLPVDALIRSIYLKKAPSGGPGLYQLAVINDDGTHVYGVGPASTYNGTDQEVDAQDVWRRVSTTTERTIRVASTIQLAYSGLAGGPFSVGETVTGGTSGSTAQVVADSGTVLTIVLASAAFTLTETLTGGTSGATATLDTETSYQGGAEAQAMASGDAFIVEYY